MASRERLGTENTQETIRDTLKEVQLESALQKVTDLEAQNQELRDEIDRINE